MSWVNLPPSMLHGTLNLESALCIWGHRVHCTQPSFFQNVYHSWNSAQAHLIGWSLYTSKCTWVSQSIHQLSCWVGCSEHWDKHQDQRCGWGHHCQHPDQPQQWTEPGYHLRLPVKAQEGTCISTEVSLVQPPKDGDLRTIENTCSVLCFWFESLREGAGVQWGFPEIICSRTNQELQKISRVYKGMYKIDLEKDIISETSVTSASSQLPL